MEWVGRGNDTISHGQQLSLEYLFTSTGVTSYFLVECMITSKHLLILPHFSFVYQTIASNQLHGGFNPF